MDKYIEALSNVSPLAVVLGALAMLVMRVLWYSNLMFGKSWARHANLPIGGMRGGMLIKGFMGTSITFLFISYLLGVAATHASVHWSAMAATVILLWLFVMLEQCNMFLWGRAPFALFLIHTFRNLFCLSAGAAVHYFWSVS